MNRLKIICILIIIGFGLFNCKKTSVKETKEVYTSSSEIELARQINISVRSDTLYFEISELDTYKDGKRED